MLNILGQLKGCVRGISIIPFSISTISIMTLSIIGERGGQKEKRDIEGDRERRERDKIYIYIYIYIARERERREDRGKEKNVKRKK